MMRIVFIIISVMFWSAIGSSLEVVGFPPDKTIVFKTIVNVELKIDIFNPPNHKPSDSRPAMVLFHGGAWAGGETSQMHAHCAYFASRGMVTFSAEYRVKNQHKTTPKECVIDGKSAVRWVRSNAASLGIDPNKIIAGGASAGGHVAAATATVKGFDTDLDQSVSCVPNALVLYNPVFDNSEGNYGFTRVKDYWQQISPAHNIDAQTPPTIVFFGDEDHHVPVETAVAYKQRMDDAGRNCALHIYPGQKHKFFNYRYTEYFVKTTVEADKFLVSLGYLDGDSTVKTMITYEQMREKLRGARFK